MSVNPMLLELLGNSNKQPMQQSLLAMMEQQDGLSPKAKMLLQMMSAGNSETENDSDIESEYEGSERINKERKLINKVYQLQEELHETQEMVDVLADAIGACSSCFGGDNQCPECNGKGQPGWQLPDHKMFAHFIVPAIKRVKAERLIQVSTGRNKGQEISTEVTQRKTLVEKNGENDA